MTAADTLAGENARRSLRLDRNEAPIPLPESFTNRVLERMRQENWSAYPDPEYRFLRSCVAEHYGLEPEETFVAGGSNTVIVALFSALTGRRVVTALPCFSLFTTLAETFAVDLVGCDFDLPSGRIDVEPLLAAARSGDVILVASPNNPSGGRITEHDLDTLLESGRDVILDRAYGAFDEIRLERRHPNLLILGTLSKAWALAGARVGWMSGPARLTGMITPRIPPYSVSTFAQICAETALEDSTLLSTVVSVVRRNRRVLFDALSRIDGVRPWPSYANFISFTTPDNVGVHRFLAGRGVYLRALASHPDTEPFALRVSVGNDRDCQSFIRELELAMKEVPR